MKGFAKTVRIKYGLVAGLAAVWFAAPLAFAAETAGNWRALWDQAFVWINFGILVFVIVKFGRAPIRNFILGKKQDIEQKIKKLEEEKETIGRQIAEIMRAVDDSRAQFEELKSKIIEQGEKNREEIIADAREMGRVMLEAARRRIDHQIQEAEAMLKAELIDAAMDLAIERLPNTITADDQNNLILHFLAGAESESA